jgi:5-methylcytosine-specific restriction protein A
MRGMAWTKRGERKGAKRLPESQRRRILRRYPTCWLALPGICTGTSTQVHHVVDAADEGPDDDVNLVGVCRPCHTHYSARASARRAWDWQRKPEKHPGVID